MLDNIIKYAVNHKLVIAALTLLLIIWGVFSLSQLPIDAVPDITNNQVQIITQSPANGALDIERLVNFPIEQGVSTIPNIVEVRSFARFGLSVITIVFNDETDVYWARQQVAERINELKGAIPPQLGTPEIAPLTTGLGEIYQYTINVDSAFKSRYSLTTLRTLQDWVIRRQLLGTKGVADVSSFGGFQKSFEINIDPLSLKNFDLDLEDIFKSIEDNNQNAGGTYIEKKDQSFFIRTEGLLTNIEALEQIVVGFTPAGIPIRLKQVAAVNIGHETRYGAMTLDDNGEVVGGIVLMLKGENSSAVIKNIKEKVTEIQKNLPEGVRISPYLDRSKLVNKAINTVSKNLLEGALIVIFVLVVMLGNIRAGLIVASVIPLAMLFAIGLMRAFGVSGNLMSLGAIDFGLIVDGAVIIVEATLHHLQIGFLGKKLSKSEMDLEITKSSSAIRNSAAFGELIILIVYLPILYLVGIEGKMFKPMAQTVIFAIAGAFILTLTYVPMMCSVLLKRDIQQHATFSDKLMQKLSKVYKPALNWALRNSKKVLLIASCSFIGALILFATLGGEFLPTLEEGDFAVETRIQTGSSLSSSVQWVSKAAKILKDSFPNEVVKVIGKIGSSEIPVDPMPIEASDMIVVLKDKENWKSAKHTNDLSSLMAEKLAVLPGVTFGFQQPIQMRFNELMTGAKQDVVIKVYGDDFDKLIHYANEIGGIASKIEGAADLFIEPLEGQPQLLIIPKRDEMALFGVSVAAINKTIATHYGGANVGQLFEGEKRFNIKVKLDSTLRNQPDNLALLYVKSDKGALVPLSQIATISYTTGYNQIQRDDAKRRIVVGFNVRKGNVETVVDELKSAIDKQVKFETGYHIKITGAYENLQTAKARLMVSVPLAILLILILLYFTFKDISLALLILIVIPLSSVGGILALWLRGMPFSISAGVGFIALFGIAVLNGIVLIAEFNRLKKLNYKLDDVLMNGVLTRLRPVVMTAMVASLGFLPMALSHGDGAEVQKPLATVVIGGLISATLLTLFVLPILYKLLYTYKFRLKKSSFSILALFCFGLNTTNAQSKLSMKDIVTMAIENNGALKIAESNTKSSEAYQKTASDISRASVLWMRGQYNSQIIDNNYTITQEVPFPTQMYGLSKVLKSNTLEQKANQWIIENQVVKNVKDLYVQIVFQYKKIATLDDQLLQYQNLLQVLSLLEKSGETGALETALTAVKLDQKLLLRQTYQNDLANLKQALSLMAQLPDSFMIDTSYMTWNRKIPDSALIAQNPIVLKNNASIGFAKNNLYLEKQKMLPNITGGYFNQSLDSRKGFTGFLLGVTYPIWLKPQMARINANKINVQTATQTANWYVLTLKNDWQKTYKSYKHLLNQVQLISNQYSGANNAILNGAMLKLKSGEVNYVTYFGLLEQTFQLQTQTLEVWEKYHLTLNELDYLTKTY